MSDNISKDFSSMLDSLSCFLKASESNNKILEQSMLGLHDNVLKSFVELKHIMMNIKDCVDFLVDETIAEQKEKDLNNKKIDPIRFALD